MTENVLLEARKITKTFRAKGGKEGVRAVDGVDLKVIRGRNVSLVGESGCGKTTLARILLKLTPPDEGRILVNQEDVTDWPEKRFRPLRKDLQMVFQDPYGSLDPRFTVQRILGEAMGLDPRRYKSRAQRIDRMDELMVAVGLDEDMLDRYPHEFSGGERQRIAIARALVLSPKVIVLDEAVSSLDVLVQDQILTLLRALQDRYQVTYLLISHNLKVVRRLSDVTGVMYKGKIVEMASTEELFQNPVHPYTRSLLAAALEYQVLDWEAPAEEHALQWREVGAGHWVLE